MCIRRFVFAAALAVVGALAAPPTSEAAFLLRLESGTQTATIDLGALSTGGPGGASSPSPYTYTFFYKELDTGVTTAVFTNLEFAGYTISAATNITNAPGTPLGGNLSLNALTVTRTAGAEDDLTLSLTATGYTLPSSQRALDSNFSARLNTMAQVTPVVDFRSSFAIGDNPFGGDVSNLATTEGANFGPTAPQEPFGASAHSSLNTNTGTYSLTNVVTITGLAFGVNNRLDQGGVSTLVTPQPAPAPAGLILVAGALPFLAVLRRRSRSASPTPETPVAA
jgi:hypothetical protein